MIISPTIPAAAPRAALARATTAPAAQDEPVGPMDFSTIDTAEKALSMPALNLLSFCSFNSVITACAMSGAGLHGSLGMAISQGNQRLKLDGQYQLTSSPSGITLACTGKMGPADFNDTWTYGFDEKLRMQGKFGNSEEDLVLSTSEKGASLDGHLGQVEVHLNLAADGMDGTVAGRKVHITNKLVPDNGGLYSVQSNGSLDGVPFNFAGKLTPDADKKGILSSGSGTIGGYQLGMTQSLIPEFPSKPS